MGSLLGFISHPMELGLIWIAVTVGSAGIGIILFTVAVRLILSPLQITQLRNAKAMQKIQPMVQELRKRHGSDKQALSEATMALYKEHNVNPAMGCLPLLLQFPILIGLFYALRSLGSSPSGYPKAIDWAKSACNGTTVHNMNQWLHACYAIKGAPDNVTRYFDLFHANFLWLSNGLGGSDPLYILPILAGATQWVQSRMMLTRTTDPQQNMMNSMTNFMPLIVVFFAIRYPSGLALYWVTSTLIGILIQYRITGWGLLSQGGLLTMANPMRMFAPQQPSRPPARTKQRPQKPALAKPENTETSTDGNGHNPNGSTPTSEVRPRKKPNRPRGGKGGRRG